jgi:hypothetical protein
MIYFLLIKFTIKYTKYISNISYNKIGHTNILEMSVFRENDIYTYYINIILINININILTFNTYQPKNKINI